ncbi:MAG: hypothetical protein ACLRWQ_11630 [Flavonifractor plautii]
MDFAQLHPLRPFRRLAPPSSMTTDRQLRHRPHPLRGRGAELILFPFSLEKGKRSMIQMNMLQGKMQQLQRAVRQTTRERRAIWRSKEALRAGEGQPHGRELPVWSLLPIC